MIKNIKRPADAGALPEFVLSLIDILAYQAARENLRRQPTANDNDSALTHFQHKDAI